MLNDFFCGDISRIALYKSPKRDTRKIPTLFLHPLTGRLMDSETQRPSACETLIE